MKQCASQAKLVIMGIALCKSLVPMRKIDGCICGSVVIFYFDLLEAPLLTWEPETAPSIGHGSSLGFAR